MHRTSHHRTSPRCITQDEDYITLKERCCKHIVDGTAGTPPGIATIEIAIDTLKARGTKNAD
jgi:hypothetical protein